NLVRSLDTDPQNDRAHYLLGTIRLSRGELGDAEKHLRIAVSLREKSGDASSLSEAHNALGVVLIHLKEYPEAIGLLQASAGEVLNREPWLANGNLGWALIEQGEYDQAIEVLRRSIFDQPKFCVGMYRLGQAYYLKQQYPQAQAALASAISVDEPACQAFQDAHHLLGMTYLHQSQDARAIEALERCVELGTTTPMGQACAAARQGL
ncbi:MAG: tetratricopeptide repeat protein, partial [Myxococcota bacterium]|nr:tetratricopeptide repeat protein [Myxococcota bacterium]